MKSELIVDVQPAEVSSALLEDGRLVSLQKEVRNIEYAVGDIYLAKVKKLMPGLNAAFVNVGYEKDAFLHYLDLGPHFATYAEFLKQLFGDRRHAPRLSQIRLLPDIDKHGSISGLLTPGQELLVQIVKEPISSKGPRLTTEISLTGRFLVLTPFSDKVSISQKIKSSEEKVRLRQLVESIKPRNFGVIVRTSAEGKKVAELNHELKTLVTAFEEACAKAQRSQAPSLVFEEQNRVVGMLRDVFSPSFENIYINDADTHSQILKYVNLIAPERRDIVKLYQKEIPIFAHFSVTRQIKSSFGKTVSFKSGAYIIIESTEALHVIDVNSGNRSKATNDQETNALEVNLRAADEIARQLRLRDMGGIIVVDFIDMAKSEHRQQLYEHMREIMANDRARHNILPLSKFGLMQITRQRVRPALDIATAEKCPSCQGKGEVPPSILFTDTLFEKLEYLVTTLGKRDFIMYIHPYVDAYIKQGFIWNMYRSWRRKLGRCFKILPDESLAYLQYRVVDNDNNEISVREAKDDGHSSETKVAEKRRRGEETRETEEPRNAEKQPQAPAKAEKAKQQQPKTEKVRQPQQPKEAKEKERPARQPETEKPKQQPDSEKNRPQPKPQQPSGDKPKKEPVRRQQELLPPPLAEEDATPAPIEEDKLPAPAPEPAPQPEEATPSETPVLPVDQTPAADVTEPENETDDEIDADDDSEADDTEDAGETSDDGTAQPKKRRRRRRKSRRPSGDKPSQSDNEPKE